MSGAQCAVARVGVSSPFGTGAVVNVNREVTQWAKLRAAIRFRPQWPAGGCTWLGARTA